MAESKKGRKTGRNGEKCKAYKNKGQRELNQFRRLVKHCKKTGLHSLSDMPPDVRAAYNRLASTLPNHTMKRMEQGVIS